jgi:hypothetical protein
MLDYRLGKNPKACLTPSKIGFEGTFFLTQAFWLYKQRPARFSSSHNMEPIAFLVPVFGLTAEANVT